MFKLTLRSLLARKARIVLTAFSVMVGVAFVSGAFILTDSFEKSFDGLFKELNAGVDFRVRGAVEFGDAASGDPVPAALADTLAAIPGVAAVEPNLQGTAVILDSDGEPLKTTGGPTLGVSWTGEGGLGGTVLRQGVAPSGAGEVAIDQATFERLDIAVGDPLQIVGAKGIETFTLVGTVGLKSGGDGFFGATLAAFDPVTAQSVLDSEGLYTTIDMAVADGADSGEVKSAIEAALPDGTEVITGRQVAEETSQSISEIVSIFRWVLLGFAMVALFVSAFLINNTFQIIISQRLRELALLRAVGANGGQVRRMVITESMIIAGVATVLGFFGGIVVSKLLTAIFNAGGAGFPDAATVIAPRTLVVALLVGFGVTLLATIVPAMRASRIPPVAAMRPELASVERGGGRRRLIGAAMLAIGAALYTYGILGEPGSTLRIILLAAVGAVSVFLGVTMLASSIAGPVSRLLGAPVAKAFGIPGDLARQNAARSPRRTASTASALMIGVALVSAVGVIASSLTDSLSEQLGSSIKADFFFTDESFQGFSSDFVDELSTLPELSGVSGVRLGSLQVAGGERSLAAIDSAGFEDIIDVDLTAGGYDGFADGGLLIHKDPAKDLDLGVGDSVDVTWKNGTTETLRVTGIFADSSITGANWMVDMSTFEAANPSSKNDLFAGARIAEGVEIDAARTAIEKVAERFPQVKVQDQAEFRKSQEDQLNQLLTVIYGLLFFAVVIAVLGIMNTLALAVFERTREFGLIRAIGATQRQLKRAVRWEAVIVSVFGALLGLLVGLPLGVIATKGMTSLGVQSTSLPTGTIILILVAAIAAGILAAIWPARRAAKLNVLEAIATE